MLSAIVYGLLGVLMPIAGKEESPSRKGLTDPTKA
jgi:hypothetical protein